MAATGHVQPLTPGVDFTASALDSLTQAQTPVQLKPAWTIIKNNFPTITATPNCIQRIRQTILQLAVLGKLVPQDPCG